MPTFGQLVRDLDERNFVGRERQMAIFREWLAADPPRPELINVSGPGGVGKSALLGAFRRQAEHAGRPGNRVMHRFDEVGQSHRRFARQTMEAAQV